MKNKVLGFTVSVLCSISALASYAQDVKYSEQSMSYYKEARDLYHNMSQKSLEKAITVYDKAIQQDKNNPYLYAGKAETLFMLYIYKSMKNDSKMNKVKMENEIVRSATFASDLNPDLPESHRAMSMAYEIQERGSESVEEAKKALELNKQDPESYLWLWNMQGDRDPKDKNIVAAYNMDSESPLINLFLGIAYQNSDVELIKTSQFDHLNKVIQKSPNNDIAYMYLGNWYEKYKLDYDKAISTIEAALEIDPKNPFALFNIGRIYEKKKMDWKAVEYYKKACDSGMKKACQTLKEKNY